MADAYSGLWDIHVLGDDLRAAETITNEDLNLVV